MKISVSSYSFSKLMFPGAMTQFDCIGEAKELGFAAIEFAGIFAPEGMTMEEYARHLSCECKRLEMPVSAFSFGADFLTGSGGNIHCEIERVKKMVDIAEILGTGLIRHDVTTGDGRSFDAVLPLIADACREITIYAAAKGIKTTVENHGFFCQDSDRLEKLFNAVNNQNFGLLSDMGNFLCADEAPEIAFGKLAPYVFYAHAKDFHVKSAMLPNPGEGFFQSRSGNYLRGAIIGHGDVPVLHCIRALKKAKFDGYIAIEFEGMEDTIEALTIGLHNLRYYISEA
jgi:sugar phosphate isomerase/epimerase